MLENLRDQASSSQYSQYYEGKPAPAPEAWGAPKPALERNWGLNGRQRFILAVMFMVVVCLLGVMLLLITGRVVPPFLY